MAQLPTPSSRSLRHLSGWNVALIASLLVFVIGFSATSLLSSAVARQAERDFDTALRQRMIALEMHYRTQMTSYTRLLYTTSTLFELKDPITNADWQRLHKNLRVNEQYPGVLSLGYAPLVMADARQSHAERLSADEGREVRLFPASDRDRSAVITYAAPHNEFAEQVIGYDLYTDADRRQAMEKARDSGNPSMTRPVVLVRDRDEKKPNSLGVIIYQALYRRGADISSESARRAALTGYVYVTVRPSDIFAHYRETGNTSVDSIQVSLRDVTDREKIEVYSIDTLQRNTAPQEVVANIFTVDTRRWELEVGGSHASLSRFYGPASIFLFGGLVSAFLSLVVYVALKNRFARVHSEYEKEVQRTKDELLALASHQLRTPASGVKQYIGMLTAGIMGELTPMQLSIAQKAYDANERQIHIIDELLYVSKADAGELMMEFSDMDMTKIVTEAVEGVSEQAKAKDIDVVFTARKPRIIKADRRYVRMIVENLISNAVKYSYSGKTVNVAIREEDDMVALDIKDQGVGIAKDDQRRLFSKFGRIPNPLSYSEGGSGLGLFLARQLALAHGGDITVASEPEKGSTFTLKLPKKSHLTSAKANIKR